MTAIKWILGIGAVVGAICLIKKYGSKTPSGDTKLNAGGPPPSGGGGMHGGGSGHHGGGGGHRAGGGFGIYNIGYGYPYMYDYRPICYRKNKEGNIVAYYCNPPYDF